MKRDGFTLIELIVIMTIFAIMASVALLNFQGFKSRVAVNNMAHDVALLLREAQTFGWATLSDESGGEIQLDDDRNPLRFAHGVYFRYDGNNFSDDLILYKKQSSNPNDQYYDENNDEEIDRISITGPYTVVRILGSNTQSDLSLITPNEIPSGNADITSNLSVAFSRPHPEAFMFEDGSSSFYNYIGIYIGPRDQNQVAEKVIIISRSGQVTVQ